MLWWHDIAICKAAGLPAKSRLKGDDKTRKHKTTPKHKCPGKHKIIQGLLSIVPPYATHQSVPVFMQTLVIVQMMLAEMSHCCDLALVTDVTSYSQIEGIQGL